MLNQLTERELEVARLIYNGLNNKEIAFRLGIATTTVRNHVKAIYSKLNVEERVHIGVWYLKNVVDKV